jgi:probable rRNA maturation factor
MPVQIFRNHLAYQTPTDQQLLQLTQHVLISESKQAGDINIILTDNKEILDLNSRYLNRDYFTDVIAFYYNQTNPVDGDIFISLDKVYDNSRDYATRFTDELIRVIVHGVLHLIGYIDQRDEDKQQMHQLEDRYLSFYHQHIHTS